eukprot:TRINITY_DN10702_c0_g1_i2.p1 TRINITY_DN10702_c0_g1~~TRINITY_DN10702_c0_g1_i2.p1  ORF type:complete len:144 (-),score=13.90 TRINITY_DN10702_c0_g1_i2:343-774(-)
MLTWMLPLVGHVGICSSDGVIHDFGGPFYVAEDNMTFGWPTRYWQLDPDQCDPEPGGVASWDTAVLASNCEYKKRVHHICLDNCHSHVATALNKMKYQGRSDWNMFDVGWYLVFNGKFTDVAGMIRTWAPATALMCLLYWFFF